MTFSYSKDHEEKEAGLSDVLKALFQNWKLIFIGTVFSVILSISISFFLPVKFKASSIIVPVSNEKESNLASQLGGLASFTGVNLSSSNSKKNEYIAILKSREFLYPFFERNNILPVLFAEKWNTNTNTWISGEKAPTLWDLYKKFHEDVFTLSEEIATGLLTVSIETEDPNISMIWANLLIKDVNDEIKNMAIEVSEKNLLFLSQKVESVKVSNIREALNQFIESELQKAMMANVSDEYAFKVIDKAVFPEEKSAPKRMIIIITGFFLGFFFFVLMALIRESFIKG